VQVLDQAAPPIILFGHFIRLGEEYRLGMIREAYTTLISNENESVSIWKRRATWGRRLIRSRLKWRESILGC